ncbi:hypothetical protein HK098_004824 [Nowakowskiella sp. JEL0407]|nr:hypothetical protein HK098_004824 [Nowakowskiella sp. JEL0407]
MSSNVNSQAVAQAAILFIPAIFALLISIFGLVGALIIVKQRPSPFNITISVLMGALILSDCAGVYNRTFLFNQNLFLNTITTTLDLLIFATGTLLSVHRFRIFSRTKLISIPEWLCILLMVIISVLAVLGFTVTWYVRFKPNACQHCSSELPFIVTSILIDIVVLFTFDFIALYIIIRTKQKLIKIKTSNPDRDNETPQDKVQFECEAFKHMAETERTLILMGSALVFNLVLVILLTVIAVVFSSSQASLEILGAFVPLASRIVTLLFIVYLIAIVRIVKMNVKSSKEPAKQAIGLGKPSPPSFPKENMKVTAPEVGNVEVQIGQHRKYPAYPPPYQIPELNDAPSHDSDNVSPNSTIVASQIPYRSPRIVPEEMQPLSPSTVKSLNFGITSSSLPNKSALTTKLMVDASMGNERWTYQGEQGIHLSPPPISKIAFF